MKVEYLDTVVLLRDLPAHGMQAGDVGAVVEVYDPEHFEVEFVSPAGDTVALATLTAEDVRLVNDSDILAIRSAVCTAA